MNAARTSLFVGFVMAGPAEGRVPAIPLREARAFLSEIAGTSPAMTSPVLLLHPLQRKPLRRIDSAPRLIPI